MALTLENLHAPSYEHQLATALVQNLMKPICVIPLDPSSKCPMEIDQLYVEKHHKEDDLHLPVRNSLAHTVSAMLSKLNLCDPRKVPSYPENGQTL